MFFNISIPMNIDPSGLENPDQNPIHLKSYRCTFCKRGFQNAQALGGHMNIHRKDRAKLKEFSSENLLSLDIMRNTDSEDSSSTSEKIILESETNHKKPISGKADDSSEENRDIVQFVKEKSISPLSLLVDEAPSMSHMAKNVEKKLNHGEVDLELRLGPEPHDQVK